MGSNFQAKWKTTESEISVHTVTFSAFWSRQDMSLWYYLWDARSLQLYYFVPIYFQSQDPGIIMATTKRKLGPWEYGTALWLGRCHWQKQETVFYQVCHFVNTLLPIDIFSFWLIIIKVKISPCEIGRYLKYKYRKCK